LISERVFLAFDTGRGLAYVQASGWQRAYLLWTFRNFRGLPHKILNARQRELVEKLYPTASFNLAHQLDEATVIGTVDDFRLQRPAPVPVSAVAEKLLPSIPAKKFADVLTRNRSEQIQALYARLAFSSLTRRVGAGALVAIMVVLGWQQLRSRPVVSASTASSAAKMRPRGQDRPEGSGERHRLGGGSTSDERGLPTAFPGTDRQHSADHGHATSATFGSTNNKPIAQIVSCQPAGLQ